MGFGRYRFRRSFGNVGSTFRGARPDTYPLGPLFPAYRRPDGTSLYRRPDGTSLYKKP